MVKLQLVAKIKYAATPWVLIMIRAGKFTYQCGVEKRKMGDPWFYPNPEMKPRVYPSECEEVVLCVICAFTD